MVQKYFKTNRCLYVFTDPELESIALPVNEG